METVEVIPAPQSDGAFTSDDLATLNETRRLRKMLIGQLMQEGKIPEDKADKALLTNLLNGLDAEVISRARVKVAAKTEEAVSDVRSMVAHALLQHRTNRPGPFSHKELEPPSHVQFRETVPGETDIGFINLKIEDIEEK